jgi:phosphopantothenoylcysteine decarboxylase/phosphopantothenate--cysteine ligase
LLGITGGIAAYKTPMLVRGLVKAGYQVKVVMTECAQAFVTPLSLATVSKNPVLHRLYDPQDGTWTNHVELGEWADLMLVAPATANTLAKMANGQADSLLLTTYLSARCPVWVSPAMDLDMWQHPATQGNLEVLRQHGVTVLPPASGELASGLNGPGRMPEPEELVAAVEAHFAGQAEAPRLDGLKILITAGPTQEAIDPVRYIGNRSSGRMGLALADVLARRGAQVTVVKGPSNLKASHPGVEEIPVTSAAEMHAACAERWPHMDGFIGAAAVADYAPLAPADQKIKKEPGTEDGLQLALGRTVDILASMSKTRRKGQWVVGFALETNNALENALGKLERKKLDLIVLNTLEDEGAGFGGHTNRVTLIGHREDVRRFDLKSKAAVAEDIADRLAELVRTLGAEGAASGVSPTHPESADPASSPSKAAAGPPS